MSGVDAESELDAFRAQDTRNALGRLLLGYGRGRLGEFALGGLSGAISIALELLPTYVLGLAIDAFFTGERAFTLPLVPGTWIPGTTRGQFFLAAGLIAGLYASAALLSWANSWAWNRFAQHLQHAIRVDTYDAMQRLELGYFDDRQTGELMSVLNNDVNQLEEFLTRSLNNAVRIAVRVGVIAVIVFTLNWQLAAVAMLVVPALAVASYWFVRRIQPKYGDVRSAVGALNARLETNLGGIGVVKAYTNEPREADRVAGASRSYLDAQWDAITTRIKFFPALRVITAAGYVVTFLLGGWWVIFGPPGPFSEPLSAGVLVTFLLYSRRFRYPMRRFGEIINDYQYAEAASQRIVGLMNEPDRVPEAPDAESLDRVTGAVAYENVRFAYDDEPVLDGVSFEAAPGELIGVVGPTGAGKTTLLKLLLRFYDPDDGVVQVDGTDVREVTVESLREHIGYVSQEPFLFDGSVRANIAYGRPDADDAAIRGAARTAGADGFITELPDGYDTQVGERGVKLSGGQRQRIALARAVLADPAILILDEATSHVDNETEILIQDNLETLIADRTTFAIAHRLSTVRDADRILVMDDGRIVERGSHEELLAADGLYANLWRVQVGEVDALPREFIERATGSRNRVTERTD